MIRTSPFLLALALVALGCDETVDVGPDATVPDGGNGPFVAVTWGDASARVNLGILPRVTLDGGATTVTLASVVTAGVPARALDTLALSDLVAGDGFRASGRSTCAGVLPVAGPTLARGYLDLATSNVRWDEALLYPGCLHVRGVAEVRVSDR